MLSIDPEKKKPKKTVCFTWRGCRGKEKTQGVLRAGSWLRDRRVWLCNGKAGNGKIKSNGLQHQSWTMEGRRMPATGNSNEDKYSEHTTNTFSKHIHWMGSSYYKAKKDSKNLQSFHGPHVTCKIFWVMSSFWSLERWAGNLLFVPLTSGSQFRDYRNILRNDIFVQYFFFLKTMFYCSNLLLPPLTWAAQPQWINTVVFLHVQAEQIV